ncbi:hypothetical protein Metal_1812 [Methylomicrobium album BG8]|uniref:Uncharacterized protein n=1 Tax=Methylomicrobium album BG8 TaxID=686340 RepID=H8GNI6_METAL|nr:hypothetical protein Metal_1812 [Methylomicrobium album BG8]
MRKLMESENYPFAGRIANLLFLCLDVRDAHKGVRSNHEI